MRKWIKHGCYFPARGNGNCAKGLINYICILAHGIGKFDFLGNASNGVAMNHHCAWNYLWISGKRQIRLVHDNYLKQDKKKIVLTYFCKWWDATLVVLQIAFAIRHIIGYRGWTSIFCSVIQFVMSAQWSHCTDITFRFFLYWDICYFYQHIKIWRWAEWKIRLISINIWG